MIKHFLKIKKLLNGSVNRPQTKKRTTTVENTQVFKDFLILARSEMDKNNLFDWNLELDFAKVRAGACHFNEKKISFSRNFIKNSSKEDIQDKLTEYQKQLAELKMTHAISPLENPLQIQTARRVIARLKTALSNQEV